MSSVLRPTSTDWRYSSRAIYRPETSTPLMGPGSTLSEMAAWYTVRTHARRYQQRRQEPQHLLYLACDLGVGPAEAALMVLAALPPDEHTGYLEYVWNLVYPARQHRTLDA